MKKYYHLMIATLVLLNLSGCDFSNPFDTMKKEPLFYEGQSIDSVQKLLGEPDGRITSKDKTLLIYGGQHLEFRDGQWVHANPDIKKRIRKSRKARASQDTKIRLKGFAVREVISRVKSNFYKQDESDSLYSDLIVSGEVTIVVFYDTWCGPCKELAPTLEWMVTAHGVALRKVDIKSWGSDVAKKYDIHSVPDVRVFDRYGRMVGDPSSDPDTLKASVLKAIKVL